MSNSKLTKEQKNALKAYKAGNPEIVFVSVGRVTVAVMQTGKDMAQFGVSIAGKSEIKLREKVGQYYALNRLLDHGMPFLVSAESLREATHNLAWTLNHG